MAFGRTLLAGGAALVLVWGMSGNVTLYGGPDAVTAGPTTRSTPAPSARAVTAADRAGSAAAADAVEAAGAAAAAKSAAAAEARKARRAAAAQERARAIRLPAGSGTGRRVVYSVRHQRVWAVAGAGQVQRTYRVSGRPTQPDPGTFRVYSRSRHTSSSVSDETMEFMVRFTHGERTGAPIGFHTIPVDHLGRPAQTVAQLGQALSAGCIRQARADAVFLWDFAPVGTKVVVLT